MCTCIYKGRHPARVMDWVEQGKCWESLIASLPLTHSLSHSPFALEFDSCKVQVSFCRIPILLTSAMVPGSGHRVSLMSEVPRSPFLMILQAKLWWEQLCGKNLEGSNRICSHSRWFHPEQIHRDRATQLHVKDFRITCFRSSQAGFVLGP